MPRMMNWTYYSRLNWSGTPLLKWVVFEIHEVTLSLDLESAVREIKLFDPYLVFNLVESINNSGELLYIAPALLNYLKIPYTGVHLEPMFITTSKLLCKKVLAGHGIPTAGWIELDNPEKINPEKDTF